VAAVWVIWWIALNVFGRGPSADDFTDSYGIVALVGSVLGLTAAHRWGGFKSTFGRSISFFSLGMAFQFFGQLIYTLYFRLAGVEAAFPSWGDVAYMASNIFYIIAVAQLLRVICYPRKFYRPLYVVAAALAITGLVLLGMYKGFLNIGITDERGLIYQLLNAAYPLVQSIYFFLGLIALFQSKILAGARMFYAIALMTVALLTQFAADFTFLYKSYHETWIPAGISDLIYLIAYGLMGISIIMVDRVRRQLASPEVVEKEAE